MSGILYKKNSATDELYKQTKAGIDRGDKMYVQPHIVIEPLTGKEKINDLYWSIHKRNPYNKVNPYNQYLEDSEEDIADKARDQKNKREDDDRVINKTQWLMKHMVEYYSGHGAVICKACGASNYKRNAHCFYCSYPIFFSKQK